MTLFIKTHIHLSHPMVVLTKLLKIFSITNYQPIYPQKIKIKREVRKLTRTLLFLITIKMGIMWFIPRASL